MTINYLYLCIKLFEIWGRLGFDICILGAGARSEMFSITLIYGNKS